MEAGDPRLLLHRRGRRRLRRCCTESRELTGNERARAIVACTSAAADGAVSPVLLVSDLGRPERFLNMLRMFKVTSPMSVGSWILVVSSGATTTAAALELLGIFRPLKRLAEAVVVRDAARRSRPTRRRCSRTRRSPCGARRATSCRSSSARARPRAPVRPRRSFTPVESAGPARRAAVVGAVARARRVADDGDGSSASSARSTRQGEARRYGRLSKGLVAAGAAAARRPRHGAAAPRRSRAAHWCSAGEVALRWSVFKAGLPVGARPAIHRAAAEGAAQGAGRRS